MSDELRGGVIDLLARLEADHLRLIQKEAVGWTVVCLDADDANRPAFSYGLYGSSLEAMQAAAKMDADDARLGDEGWTHAVVPVLRKP